MCQACHVGWMTTKPPKTAKPKPKSKAGAHTKTAAPKKPPGPMVRFTQEVADAICELLATGNSLRSICERDGMPRLVTVMRWLNDDAHADFRLQYVRAREAQADFMAEDLLDIADEECTMVKADKHGAMGNAEGMVEVTFDATAVARNRLRVDARKWLMSKMAPKKYGDKLQAELSGPGGAPIAIQSTVTFVRPPARDDDDS